MVIGKKQMEDLVPAMATDFDLFYAIRSEQAQEALKAILGSPESITLKVPVYRCAPRLDGCCFEASAAVGATGSASAAAFD